MTQASRLEAMRTELESKGHIVNVVGINIVGGESWTHLLVDVTTYDILQDTAAVRAWNLMGGHKDDFFIYREGGTLAPGGYLPTGGSVNTNLSTGEGYNSVYNKILEVVGMGPGDVCPEPGRQLPGNVNQDDSLDMSDAVTLLLELYGGAPRPLPCESGGLDGPGNRKLLDLNGDVTVDLSDAIYLLMYLFTGGTPPVLGTQCTPVAGCPDACGA